MPRAALFAIIAALSSSAGAQEFVGRWEVRNQQGGTTTLVLTEGGVGKLGGTFSGNGNSFAVAGAVAGDEATGTITGRGMALFFQAQVKGTTLLLVVAEPGPAGTPNLATAQQILMTRTTAAAGASPSATAATPAPSPLTGAARASPTGPSGVTAQDQQMIRMLTANAWCAFAYSGTQTFSSASGNTRTERVVLAPDGSARSNAASERTSSGENGSVAASGGEGTVGRWRFERGVLAFSADGVAWQPANFKMTFNSNGSPIPVVDGREFMVCR